MFMCLTKNHAMSIVKWRCSSTRSYSRYRTEVSFMLRPFYPLGKGTLYLLDKRLGVAKRNVPLLDGIRIQFLQPVAID